MITTHVLDTALGRPAADLAIDLEHDLDGDGIFELVGTGHTDAEGRLRSLTPEGPVRPGAYLLRFHTAEYFGDAHVRSFYPVVEIRFLIDDGDAHYHVPLLLSPFGYSTYRGS